MPKRLLSLLEVCLAFAIVVAHNVFHAIPNEVPILVILAVLSFRLRGGTWGFELYRKPASWTRTVLLALLCFSLLLVKDDILERIGHRIWTAPERVSTVVSSSSHNPRQALLMLAFVWIFAAFGEEIAYRGYLLRRAADVFGPAPAGQAVALLVAAIAFGFGHYYKGDTGILESTGSGLILGAAYLLSRRLWISTLAHGINDTVAIALSFFGVG